MRRTLPAAPAIIVTCVLIGLWVLRVPLARAADTPFYVDPDTAAAAWVTANPDDPRSGVVRDRIADVPQARWFTQANPDAVKAQVESYVDGATQAGKTPIMVVYNIPNRDCNGASAGGAPDADAYHRWIDQVALGLTGRSAVAIVEPDALAQAGGCASSREGSAEAAVAYAGKQLKGASPNVKVYLDAGHSHWIPPAEMAARLTRAGVAQNADGIATNVSNYYPTADEVAYAREVLAALGAPNLHAVIDTSRNGNGAVDGQWCDPPGRAVGAPSTTATGDPQIDAYLWVKAPGEADGCIAGAGQFVPQRAYDLATAN